MRRALLLLGAGVALSVAAAQPASTQSSRAADTQPDMAAAPIATTANVPVPALTPAEAATLAPLTASRLTPVHDAVAAIGQRAVLDGAEQLFREPSPAEAAALAVPDDGGAATELPAPGGGVAVRTTASDVSLLVATATSSGVVTTHDAKAARRDR